MAAGQTPSQTVGPYFALGMFAHQADKLVAADVPGAVRVTGQILDGAGAPVPDAMVEVWQADQEGRYKGDFGWGRSGCDVDGRFAFITVKPGRVADGSGGWQAPHLMVMVFARGLLKPVLTRMYFPDEEEANADDQVLSAVPDRSSLIARPTDDRLEFDVRLQGEGETVFFTV